jgi:Putative zinc-finger
MNAHPDPQTLRAYARGTASPAATMEIDAHARSCATCREALLASVDPKAMRRVLARVERAGGHVAFEELSAMADGKLAAPRRQAVEGHLKLCGRCRREWVDLQRFAPVLARPLRAKAAPSEGVLAALSRWIASSNGLRTVAAGVVVAAAATLFFSNQFGPGGGGSDATSTSARFGGSKDGPPDTTTAPKNEPAAAQRDVFERLDQIAPEAVSAYRKGDFAAVAKALRPRAARGEAAAAHALGVLYAEGRGVAKDPTKAAALLEQAVAGNDAGATADLAKLRRPARDGGSH